MSRTNKINYSLNITGGNLIVSGGTTLGNLNLTGNLLQNGAAFSTSQWTTTAGNVSYTSGSVVVSNGLSATGNSNTVGSLFTTGGNVGVGTTSPATKLHVNGGLTLEGRNY